MSTSTTLEIHRYQGCQSLVRMKRDRRNKTLWTAWNIAGLIPNICKPQRGTVRPMPVCQGFLSANDWPARVPIKSTPPSPSTVTTILSLALATSYLLLVCRASSCHHPVYTKYLEGVSSCDLDPYIRLIGLSEKFEVIVGLSPSPLPSPHFLPHSPVGLHPHHLEDINQYTGCRRDTAPTNHLREYSPDCHCNSNTTTTLIHIVNYPYVH